MSKNTSSIYLKATSFNCNSLSKRIDEIKNYIIKNNIHIMALNETKTKAIKKINGFDYINKNRDDSSGGGVAFYIHKLLNYKKIEPPNELAHLEIIIIELEDIEINNEKLIIAAYYNPPQIKISHEALEYIFQLSSNIVLLGDLNAHHESWYSKKNCPSGLTIHDFLLNSNNFLLNDNTPTYEPEHNPTYKAILDLAISSQPIAERIILFDVSDELMSDHLPINITIKCPHHKNLTNLNENHLNNIIKQIACGR